MRNWPRQFRLGVLDELFIENSLIFLELPKSQRAEMLKQIQTDHLGMTENKIEQRQHIWPGMNKANTDYVLGYDVPQGP